MHMRNLFFAIFLTSVAFAQSTQPPASQPAQPQSQPGAPATAPQQKPPDTTAPAPQAGTSPAQPTPARPAGAQSPASRAAAYYHYSVGHYYEEMITTYGRSEYLNNAIEEYKQAIAADPNSQFLNAALAELYAHTGRLRDAVNEATDVLRRDPDNLQAHKLLAHIYVHALGDIQSGTQSREMLQLAITQFEAIVRLEPEVAENHLMLGRLYHAANDPTRAEAQFKAATAIDPGYDDPNGATIELANLYTDEGNTQRAISTLSSLPEGARTGKTYMALAYAFQQSGDSKNAIKNYRKAIELDRENLDAHRGLATSLLAEGETDAALAEYKTVVAADAQDAQSLTRMADIYRRTGRFEQSLEALKQAEGVSQDSIEIPYIRAQIFEAQGRFDEAAAILQTLVQRSSRPENSAGDRNNLAIFLERLGTVYKEGSRPALALETYRKMLDLGPELAVRGYENLIDSYNEQKQYQEALRIAQEGTQKLPDSRTLKLRYAEQLAESGRADDGIAQARSLLKNTPADADVWAYIGQINLRLKRWKDAEEAVAKAAQLSSRPEQRQSSDFLLAEIYERQKKFDEAEQVFKKLLASDPENASVLNYLGYMLADRGVRLEEALGYIKRAVALDPQNGAYLDSLGWAYFKLGNYELAEENLRKASDRMANDGTIQDHLGDLYHKTGRLKLAATHWERAIDEWNKTVPGDVDPNDVSRTQKKLEGVKVKLAQQGTTLKQ